MDDSKDATSTKGEKEMKYQIIYADPPWKQKRGRPFGKYKMIEGRQVWNMKSSKSAELPYPTMNLNEIANLRINQIADNNAVLFIWVTNKYLPFVFNIINRWGFKYSTTLTWCKNIYGNGLGGTFRSSSEYLIFARKGKLKSKQNIKGTWFEIKRQYVNGYPKHSLKPDFFRTMIDKIFNGNKIELFAREKTEGWDVWGNEVESDIELQALKEKKK